MNHKRPQELSRLHKDGNRAPKETSVPAPFDQQPSSTPSGTKNPSPSAPSFSRSKESRRPAVVPRSRAMRLETGQDTSRRRPSSKEIRDAAPMLLKGQHPSPGCCESGTAVALSCKRTHEQQTPLSSTEHPSVSKPATHSLAKQEQRTPLPPPPVVLSTFQD